MTEQKTYAIQDFSAQYFLLRKKEGRIYSDEELLRLPEIDKQHRYHAEWEIRKRSSDQLRKYLWNKKRPLQILENGCGNGWLSAKLSGIPLSQVIGIDINSEELNQGRRVFSKIDNLKFYNCSLQDEVIRNHQFDVIIFAASIQYFPSLRNILNDALSNLKPGGEIHIIDTHFYDEDKIAAARQRSEDYFNTIGFPEMAQQYFHHSLEVLRTFDHEKLYDPHSVFNKLKKNKNPFYWICIKANA